MSWKLKKKEWTSVGYNRRPFGRFTFLYKWHFSFFRMIEWCVSSILKTTSNLKHIPLFSTLISWINLSVKQVNIRAIEMHKQFSNIFKIFLDTLRFKVFFRNAIKHKKSISLLHSILLLSQWVGLTVNTTKHKQSEYFLISATVNIKQIFERDRKSKADALISRSSPIRKRGLWCGCCGGSDISESENCRLEKCKHGDVDRKWLHFGRFLF